MIWEPLKVCTMSSVRHRYVIGTSSVHRVTNFKDIEIDENLLALSVKSFSDTRWACRYDAIRAIAEQMERAIKVMIFLSKEKDSKSSDARNLILQFVTSTLS